MTWESHFVVKFGHNLMVYFTSHPGILWSIPVNRHVLYLHFVLLLQAMGGFRFAYNWQLPVIRAVHIGNNKQCKSVFLFCRACRLITTKAISPMRQRLVKQGSFIPIVNVIWWVPGKGGEKNSYLPGFKFIIGSCRLFATTDCLVDNAIPLSPPGNIRSITLPIWMAELLWKAERLKIV